MTLSKPMAPYWDDDRELQTCDACGEPSKTVRPCGYCMCSHCDGCLIQDCTACPREVED